VLPCESALLAWAVARQTRSCDGIWQACRIASVAPADSVTLDLIFSGKITDVPNEILRFDPVRDNINVFYLQELSRNTGQKQPMLVAVLDPYDPSDPGTIVRVQEVDGAPPPSKSPTYLLDLRDLLGSEL